MDDDIQFHGHSSPAAIVDRCTSFCNENRKETPGEGNEVSVAVEAIDEGTWLVHSALGSSSGPVLQGKH